MKKRCLSFLLAAGLMLTSTMSAFAMETEPQLGAAQLQETLPKMDIIPQEENQEQNGEAQIESVKRDANEAALCNLVSEDGEFLDSYSPMIPLYVPVIDYGAEAYKMLNYINQYRSIYGYAPLRWDSRMENYAGIRATETMYKFDGGVRLNGRPWHSLDEERMDYELVAKNYFSAESLWNSMRYDGDMEPILDPNVKSLGVALRINADEEYHWALEYSYAYGDGQYRTNGDPYIKKQVVSIAANEEGRQVRNFVLRLYQKVLGRQADVQGLAEWTTNLLGGLNTGSEAAYGFFFSDEFKNKNTSNEEYVTILYQTILNRDPDGGGMEAWTKLLRGGLSRAYVLHGLCESDEFTNLCASYGINRGNVVLTEPRDQNSGVTLFVSRLYEYVLGRSADVGGLNEWTNQILTGWLTPENVAYGIVFSPEFKNKHVSDGEYVNILYRVFMDRNADPAGYQSWTSALKRGESRENVFYGFSKSPEFGKILRSFGL